MPKDRIDKWLGRIRNVVEILAILVAGWWVLTGFIIGDAPSLSPRISIEANLNWSRLDKDSCFAEHEVIFRNIGKVTLAVEEAFVAVSLVKIPAVAGPVEHLDPTKLDRWLAETVNLAGETGLGGIYGPDEGTKVGTTFKVKKAPGRIVLFGMFMKTVSRRQSWLARFDPLDTQQEKHWYDHRWEYACVELLRTA